MAEVKQGEIVRDDLASRELKDLINHWVEVIDDWVSRLDQGMGGTAQNGADPTGAGEPPDPLPRAAARHRACAGDRVTK